MTSACYRIMRNFMLEHLHKCGGYSTVAKAPFFQRVFSSFFFNAEPTTSR